MNAVEDVDPAPADAIDNFAAMHVTQTGLNRYAVVDLEEGVVHQVRTGGGDGPNCTCLKEDDAQVSPCSHLMYAVYRAPETVDADRFALEQVGSLQADVVNALSRVEAALSGGGGGGSTSGSDPDDEEAEEPDPIDDPGEEAEDLIDQFDQWLTQAVKFDPDADEDAFDHQILDLKWAMFEGSEGIWIDSAPFETEYWDSDAGEWSDQDGYQAAREALVEVLQKRDEISYSGPPAYVNFVEEDDVDEVVK